MATENPNADLADDLNVHKMGAQNDDEKDPAAKQDVPDVIKTDISRNCMPQQLTTREEPGSKDLDLEMDAEVLSDEDEEPPGHTDDLEDQSQLPTGEECAKPLRSYEEPDNLENNTNEQAPLDQVIKQGEIKHEPDGIHNNQSQSLPQRTTSTNQQATIANIQISPKQQVQDDHKVLQVVQEDQQSAAKCLSSLPQQEFVQQAQDDHRPFPVVQEDQQSAAQCPSSLPQQKSVQQARDDHRVVQVVHENQQSAAQCPSSLPQQKSVQQAQDDHRSVQVVQKDQQSAAQCPSSLPKKKSIQQAQKQERERVPKISQNQRQVSQPVQDHSKEESPQSSECKGEKKKKKKKFSIKKKLSKLKRKMSQSDVSSCDGRTEDGKEPIASVYIDSPVGDDCDVAKLHISEKRAEPSSHQDTSSDSSVEIVESLQYIQEYNVHERRANSGSGSGHMVPGGASFASLDDHELVPEEEIIPDIPKIPAPRLDKSKLLTLNFRPPARYTPKCSPIEQYYDVLIIHSDKDWNEVDYMKKVGKRYGWKMISVEKFPVGMTKFQIFSIMLARCSYSMLLLTKNFYTDVWCNQRYSACLTAAVERRNEMWSVVPVVYRDSGYETPLELITVAGLQREARYFKKNLKSTVCSGLRKEREEELGFPHELTPPSSPDSTPPSTPKASQKSPAAAVASPEIKEDITGMTSGELYRLLKPELTPNETISKFFRCDDRFRKICLLLDMEDSIGRDYRLLAQMMGFDAGETRSLGQEASPTAKLLEVFCLKNKDKPKLEALGVLLDMVKELDQHEVTSLVENEIKVAKFTS